MRLTRIVAVAFIVATALTAFDSVARDEIYRWVDEKGVVHFGDLPPGQADAEQIEHRQHRPGAVKNPDNQPQANEEQLVAEPSYAESRRQERATKRQQAAQKRRAIDAQCARQRRLLARFEPHPRVMVENEDGTVSRIGDNERLQVVADTKTYISENCHS